MTVLSIHSISYNINTTVLSTHPKSYIWNATVLSIHSISHIRKMTVLSIHPKSLTSEMLHSSPYIPNLTMKSYSPLHTSQSQYIPSLTYEMLQSSPYIPPLTSACKALPQLPLYAAQAQSTVYNAMSTVHWSWVSHNTSKERTLPCSGYSILRLDGHSWLMQLQLYKMQLLLTDPLVGCKVWGKPQADAKNDPFNKIPWTLTSLAICFFVICFCFSTFKLWG